MVSTDSLTRMFSYGDRTCPLLRQKIIDVGNVNLVQIDPISA